MWRDPIVTSLQACTLFFVQCPALCADSAWAVSSLSLGGASALVRPVSQLVVTALSVSNAKMIWDGSFWTLAGHALQLP